MSNARIVATGDRPSLDLPHRVNEHQGADAAPQHLQCGGKYLSKLPIRMGGMARCTGPGFCQGCGLKRKIRIPWVLKGSSIESSV
jgi:hypothetical protein